MKIERLFGRFVDDNKLPIQKIEDKEYISYVLDIINKKDQWDEFCNRVKERFGENINKYFEYYAEVKESFLNYVKNSVEFIEFNRRDMNEFKIENPSNISKSIYTKNNDGKYFLSIDLKKANFQALKYCGLFKNFETWEELIKNFTDFPELINSKYMRSVLFGQLNPGRHITIESYLINSLRPYFSSLGINNLVMMARDELVYEFTEEQYKTKSLNLRSLERIIKENYGLNITADFFKLTRHALIFERGKEIEFFDKSRFITRTLHCIPSTYYIIAYKLFYDMPINSYDLIIEHDGILTNIKETVKLV